MEAIRLQEPNKTRKVMEESGAQPRFETSATKTSQKHYYLSQLVQCVRIIVQAFNYKQNVIRRMQLQ
jgi:hypothetical protein